jgi:L-alanine-DL-glutamate epimerase-like enolase superfamily enzyme
LAALICCSPYDIALHDAYGVLHDIPIYEAYGPHHVPYDLTRFFSDGHSATRDLKAFVDQYPADYLQPKQDRLRAWHLVGGLDALDESDLTGEEPDDGYPVTLVDWIKRDGLTCLKIKLRGTDAEWDYSRIVRVGRIAADTTPSGFGAGGASPLEDGVGADLSVDFNCTVTDPAYVVECLDRLERDEPSIYRRILYVEQPFPYDLERYQIDVRAITARKPLFMDESAHDWQHVRTGAERGWNGVALKTCKTQTGAILSMCWARAYGMALMVQDLTNPMLAQIPHVLLAAHAGTIMGVETNAMQFYPAASRPEAAVHPGLYQRRHGNVDLHTLRGPGFGYRLAEIDRLLPEPTVIAGEG